jgi:hypothetical protein
VAQRPAGVVGRAFVVPRLRDQLVEHGGVDRASNHVDVCFIDVPPVADTWSG